MLKNGIDDLLRTEHDMQIFEIGKTKKDTKQMCRFFVILKLTDHPN